MPTSGSVLGRGLQEVIFALGIDSGCVGSLWGAGRRPWLSHFLVHQLLEVAQRSNGTLIVKRQHLHHHNDADMSLGIDPELGVVNTSPAHAAHAAELCILRVAGRDLKTEAELIVAGAQRKRFAERLVGGLLQLHEDRSDVVLAHHLYRVLAQNFRGPQVPAVEQHLHELAVILGGRVQAAIASERGRRRRRYRFLRLFLQHTVYTAVLRRHARLFGERHGVGRIHHAQRYEDVLLEVCFE